MGEAEFLEAIGRLDVNETVEYTPPRRERIELAGNTYEARRKVMGLTENYVIRVSRPEVQKFVIRITSPW